MKDMLVWIKYYINAASTSFITGFVKILANSECALL